MKKAVMYGAGNIGRGFIGQLFSQSGYEVVFVDINPVVLERLNSDRSYPIRVVGNGSYEEITVQNVRAVSAADPEAVAAEIASADLMATAVGVNVLARIAAPIAAGLKKRWRDGRQDPLNIIICENLLDANHYLAKLVKEQLGDAEKALFEERVGLVEASIGRMVPVMTTEMQEGNPLRVWVEPFCQLPVDKAAFKGDIPAIKNMVPFAPFDFYIQRKLFMHNMGHATVAYLGFLKGVTYIWEAVSDSGIRLIALRALQESGAALAKDHGVDSNTLLEHAEDLLYRFGNQLLGDTVERVGKDPVRKLAPNDRLVGAARLCEQKGIEPVYIAVGLAAGYIFHPEEDTFAASVQETVKNSGIEAALKEFSGLDSNEPLAQRVITFYRLIKSGATIAEVLEKAEEFRR